MWNWIVNFYKSNKYAVLWTAGYFIITWAIMKYMFDFNIFSSLRWHQLAHAHLHGFAGFVFGILILAAVPMYVATTTVIARTKAPLFSIKIPECIKKFFQVAFTQTPMVDTPEFPTPQSEQTTVEVAPADTTQEPTTEPAKKKIPDSVPSEMRIAYMRAREHISRTPTSAFGLGNITNATQKPQNFEPTAEDTNIEMPIPSDFDIEDADDMIDSVPQFTDISFDDDDGNDEQIEINDINNESDTTAPVAEYMKSQSVPYTIENDVVITDKFAIVAHTDPEFWVADAENWFAAGKTRKSPIESVKNVASIHNLEPVLYLGADNIMDIDELRTTWEKDGIRIITDLKDLI